MTALPGDRDVQTEAGRRLLDRLEKTWGVVHGHGPAIEVTHEDFTAAQIASILAIETEAYDAGLRVEAESVGGLEAAWNEAEAALPEGWVLAGVRMTVQRGEVQEWQAWADNANTDLPEETAYGDGPTPAAALHALALALGSDK